MPSSQDLLIVDRLVQTRHVTCHDLPVPMEQISCIVFMMLWGQIRTGMHPITESSTLRTEVLKLVWNGGREARGL